MAGGGYIGVVGAGAWGTAIAMTIARAGHNVVLWAREEEVVKSINTTNENSVFLAGIKLSKSIKATSNYKDMLSAEALFLVPPSQFQRSTCEQLLAAGLAPSVPLVLCSKGVEQQSLKLMSEVAAEVCKNPLAILSGPTFADEVAKGLPASVTLTCRDEKLTEKLAAMLRHKMFKIYPSNDMVGAQISGSVKNVLAIACGIAEGRELGQNAQAALITGGLAEIRRLCIAKGGRSETLMGLCGLGDVILTCGSPKSRNMSLGMALGKGQTLKEYMQGRKTVAEGVYSADSVTRLAKSLGVNVPICEAVYRIVHQNAPIETIVEELILSS